MKRSLYAWLALSAALMVSEASARTRIIVLPPDAATIGTTLTKYVAGSVLALSPGDRLLIYAAWPISQIAAIALPTDPTMNKARINAAMAKQFKPVKDYLTTSPVPSPAEPPGNLNIPFVIEEFGRNVLPGLPEKGADVLLVGSWLFWDRRDHRTAMTDRYVPSDSMLRAPRVEWPFSVVGAQERLANSKLFYCWPNGEADIESALHEERLRRWWSLWTTSQGGTVGTMSFDLAVCFQRFNSGETSGQPVYQPSRDGKPEMLRVPALVPAALPASFENPTIAFLRDDAPISTTPPTVTKGIAWVGIKWNVVGCDLDLYARGDASSPWLYYGNVRTVEGHFNKDWMTATGESQYEFIEFSKEVDLVTADVAINIYSCDATTAPEGRIRVWFASRVFEMPFKMSAKSGNKGAQPMIGPHWLKVDLRKVVGLTRE